MSVRRSVGHKESRDNDKLRRTLNVDSNNKHNPFEQGENQKDKGSGDQLKKLSQSEMDQAYIEKFGLKKDDLVASLMDLSLHQLAVECGKMGLVPAENTALNWK